MTYFISLTLLLFVQLNIILFPLLDHGHIVMFSKVSLWKWYLLLESKLEFDHIHMMYYSNREVYQICCCTPTQVIFIVTKDNEDMTSM